MHGPFRMKTNIYIYFLLDNRSYHDNAYATSRALHIVNRTNSSATFCLLEWFFKQQVRNLSININSDNL